jgi:hypothetical protein
LQNQDAERGSLLAELVELSGREELRELMRNAPIEEIRDDVASRRKAVSDRAKRGRMASSWYLDKAELED